MNVMLVGGESAALHTLKTVTRTDHKLVAVLASPSRSGFPASGLANLAANLGVPVRPAQCVRDPGFATEVRDLGIDVLLNVHSLYIIDRAVLEAPRLGCFNLHPGPLPECAGLNAPSWAIQQGARSHGVSLHWMVPSIDMGPIAYAARFPIDDTDSGLSLSLKCIRAGLPLVEQLLHTAACGFEAIPRVPQNLADRRYFSAGPPDEGRLSWASPARQVFDLVRAADYRPFTSPWKHPRTVAHGREFGIVSARCTGRPASARPGSIGDATDDGVEVACGDEWLLVREVEDEGRYQRAALAFESIDCLT